jgi:hypothetical protein
MNLKNLLKQKYNEAMQHLREKMVLALNHTKPEMLASAEELFIHKTNYLGAISPASVVGFSFAIARTQGDKLVTEHIMGGETELLDLLDSMQSITIQYSAVQGALDAALDVADQPCPSCGNKVHDSSDFADALISAIVKDLREAGAEVHRL